MILPRYRIDISSIPAAGKGLYIEEAVTAGQVLIAPDNVHTVWSEARLRQHAEDSIEVQSSVRWFEDWYSLTPEWSDECYVNHAFAPTALWHLGFIFALRALPPGSEITMDYQLVIGSGETLPFVDAASGRAITGLPWPQALAQSTAQLLALFPLR